jgi:long-chain acyl-CoA synthetase
MGVRDFTVYDMIHRNAQIYAERDAVVFGDRRITYGQFRQKCDSVAGGLHDAGVKKGDRIGVVAHNSDEFLILYGAAAKLGAIVVPVNWRFQPSEVEYVLKDVTPRLVFAGPQYTQTVKEAVSGIPSVEGLYTIGGGEPDGDFSPFSSLDRHPSTSPPEVEDSELGYVIIHTAAVEGRPRGALLSQSNVIHSSLLMMSQHKLTPDDCHIGVLPLFHVAGLSLTMATFHAGGKNVILERFDAKAALELIRDERGTVLFNFAPILSMLLDNYEEGKDDLSSLRLVLGLDRRENIERFLRIAPHTKFWAGFGQTEAMGVSGCPMDERPGSAGKPSPISRVILVDEYDREVPVGEPGEICVRSPTVFLGYWGREEDTAYTFRGGWHHTGDIGRLDEEGYLWYVKRKAEKELIKPGGENVYPAEVEKTILEHGAVSEVCVIGVPDPQWGEAIKAVCVLKPGQKVEPQEIIDFVASRIARYKKPKHVVFVESLPKRPDGAVDREKVKAQHGGRY